MILRTATSEDKNKLLELEQAVVEAERPFNAQIKTTGAPYYDMDDLLISEHSELKVIELFTELARLDLELIRNVFALVPKETKQLVVHVTFPKYFDKLLVVHGEQH